MSRFEVAASPLPGLTLLHRKVLGDHRGYLERLFCVDDLQPLFGSRSIVQINRTLTAASGTVRGLHFQYPPAAEMKLVSCLRGEVFDVAVDLRRGSSTFLRWHAEILSADNHRTLLIPEGFAHGFQTLTNDCELVYLHTARYQPKAESGLNAADPRLAVAWPLPIAGRSDRDASLPLLTAEFTGVEL